MSRFLKSIKIVEEVLKTYPDYSLKAQELLKFVTLLKADGRLLWRKKGMNVYEGCFVLYMTPIPFVSYRELRYCYGRFNFTGTVFHTPSYRMFYKIIRNELYKIFEELMIFIKENKKLEGLVPWKREGV